MSEKKTGVNIPYMKLGGEWDVLEKKKYGPAKAIREDMGIAVSAPVRGECGDRHEMRRIAVLMLRGSSKVATAAYFDYIENARRWVSDCGREVSEFREEEWMNSNKKPTEYLTDEEIVLIKPEEEHVPSTETLNNRRRGGYAGALQAHDCYETAENEWNLQGFKTLSDRVKNIRKRLNIAEDIDD